MRVLYLESVGGAAGDMILGALCGLGLDWDEFRKPLEAALPELVIRRETVSVRGLKAWRLWAETTERPRCRHLADIRELVDGLPVPDMVRRRIHRTFERLAAAEAAAHGCSVEEVHFHEVGAVDSIMDIAGFHWAVHLLGVDRIEASPLRLGYGSVETEHGLLPVPVPAVAELVKGLPVECGPCEGELTTPTAAVLIGCSAERFGPLPAMKVTGCGCGAGSRNYDCLNVHRAWLGETACDPVGPGKRDGRVNEDGSRWAQDLVMLEFNVDDSTPEQLSFAREELERLGALDVSFFPGQGKKGRPLWLVQVLVPLAFENGALDVVFRHTSTLGVRRSPVARYCLERRFVEVELDGRPVRVKVASWMGKTLRYEPEYEDCARLAGETSLPIAEVMASARIEARNNDTGGGDALPASSASQYSTSGTRTSAQST